MNTMTLPTHAGGVPLEYVEHDRMPERIPAVAGQSSRLVLPLREGMEYNPVKNGDQFFIIYPGTTGLFRGAEGRAFFGGMDEAPFITSMEPAAVAAFRKGGEQAFFEALVPEPIKIFQKKFPDAEVRRQGDVWSLRLPMSWDELRGMMKYPAALDTAKVNNRHARKTMKKQYKRRMREFGKFILRFDDCKRFSGHLLGTENHAIQGRSITGQIFVIAGVDLSRQSATMIVEGVLTAPDHAAHELLDGPHLLARTPHITPVARFRLRGGD